MNIAHRAIVHEARIANVLLVASSLHNITQKGTMYRRPGGQLLFVIRSRSYQRVGVLNDTAGDVGGVMGDNVAERARAH